MKNFDLSNITVEDLNEELIDFFFRQDKVIQYKTFLDILDRISLFDNDIELSKFENFLSKKQFSKIREVIFEITSNHHTHTVSDYLSLANKGEDFLPAVIAYLVSLSYREKYEDLLEQLKDKYYIKRQRKLKLKQILDYESQSQTN